MTYQEIHKTAKYFYENPTIPNCMLSSAKVCLDDASYLIQLGKEDLAKRRLLKSLGYTIGICHPNYMIVDRELNNI